MEVKLSERVMSIIGQQAPQEDVLGQTLEFVRRILGPDVGRYDMLYRYEHTLRVAAVGRRIAEEEGLPKVPLMMACLLHDVGYPECASMEEWAHHAEIGARIAELYLKQIGFDERMAGSICKAVLIHDREELSGDEACSDAAPFELSVRDADDIDRFDVMRMCILGYHDIGERPAEEVMEACRKRLRRVERYQSRVCGTETARKMWLEEMEMHRKFYQGLLEQMQSTGEAERFIRGEDAIKYEFTVL